MKQQNLWVALCSCLALFFVAHGCGSPLVGLECRDGFSRCGGACYDLQSDVAHCGGCGITCAASESCVASACMPPAVEPGDGGADGSLPDGSLPDGSLPDDGGMDARVADATIEASDDADIGDADADGGSGDAQTPPQPVLCTGPGSPADCVCGRGQLACNLVCVEALTDRNNCGGCASVCDPGFYCAAGECEPRCDAPLMLCPMLDLCVNILEDVNHCGSCTAVPCAPGASCIDGVCVGSAVGHIVAIGHDMSAARAPMRTLVGNAVFLVRSAPVRVLVYDENTTPASRLGVSNAIQTSAAALGRTYITTPAVAAQVSLQLSSADVFVIEVQQSATDLELQGLGQQWGLALADFLKQGGVIVLFDGGGGNSGTIQILGPNGANLIDVVSRADIPRAQYELYTPSDAIGAGVPSRYQSEGQSAVFNMAAMTTRPPVVVVRDPTSMYPVVLHLPVVTF